MANKVCFGLYIIPYGSALLSLVSSACNIVHICCTIDASMWEYLAFLWHEGSRRQAITDTRVKRHQLKASTSQ